MAIEHLTETLKAEQREQLASALSCHPDELEGECLRDCLEAAERQGGIIVHWGLWSDSALDDTL